MQADAVLMDGIEEKAGRAGSSGKGKGKAGIKTQCRAHHSQSALRPAAR
jgi:hypothetical protein